VSSHKDNDLLVITIGREDGTPSFQAAISSIHCRSVLFSDQPGLREQHSGTPKRHARRCYSAACPAGGLNTRPV